MAQGTEGAPKVEETAKKKEKKAKGKAAGVVRFDMFKGVSNMFYWRFIGTKGTPIVVSQGVAHEDQCYEGIRNVKENSGNQNRYEKASFEGGKFGFRLRAANHRVVAESVPFGSAEERDQAMGEMKRAYQAAIVSP